MLSRWEKSARATLVSTARMPSVATADTAIGGLTQRAFVAVLVLWTVVVAARVE